MRATIEPGDAEFSELYRRVILPPSHEEFMPPNIDKYGMMSQEDIIILGEWLRLDPLAALAKVADSSGRLSLLESGKLRSGMLTDADFQQPRARLDWLTAAIEQSNVVVVRRLRRHSVQLGVLGSIACRVLERLAVDFHCPYYFSSNRRRALACRFDFLSC